jgi:DNA invertase Pin-like site-specific DNA recombinase
MKYGYARTSTPDQTAGLAAQVTMLEAAGCEEIIREHASAVGRREAFDILMQHKLRRGDMLVVTKMGRLARSISRLLTIVEALKVKGVDLMILDFSKGESINTNSPSGKLMLTMFGAFAEFERSNMLEPQRAGVEKAKQAGKYTGRKPTAMNQRDRIAAMDADGLTRLAIAQRLGISERSVYRALGSGDG